MALNDSIEQLCKEMQLPTLARRYGELSATAANVAAQSERRGAAGALKVNVPTQEHGNDQTH